MDPVTAVGLVAAIIQLVEFGTKVTERFTDFSSAGLQDGPPTAFKYIMAVLPLIMEGLQNLQSRISDVTAQARVTLHTVVQSCLSDVQTLNQILDKVLPSSKASKWEKGKKALASIQCDKEIDRIAGAIKTYIGVLTFHQVVEMSQNYKVKKPTSPQKGFWVVPYDKNRSFVQRDGIFDEIERELSVGEGVQPRTALYGLGGIGKSQIALEYCYRRQKKDERCSVFWCNAATVARFEESLSRIAKECRLVLKEETGTDVAEALKPWLESQDQGRWLMVIDNVDDANIFYEQPTRAGKKISECIPQCANGSLIFTTRNSDIAIDVANPAKPIIIPEMNVAEGLKLARTRLPDDTPEDLLIELLQVLEFIPLAITQASAFIAKRKKTVRYYLEQYRKSDATKTRLLSYEFSDHARQGSTMESLAKTWMLSFDAIRESNPRAAELLCLMTFFQHQEIPAILLQNEEEDELDFQDASALLKAFSFIDADEEDSIFSTHRLVQLATKWWLQKELPAETERWASAALKSVATQFPKPTWTQ